jgi:hypothetical protein
MSRMKYQEIKFAPATLKVIDQVNQIAGDYTRQGYDLTLRQLYYQFVARGLIANKQTEYKRLGDIVNNGRMAGMIDWNYVTDRTRNLQGVGHFRDVADMIAAAAHSHRLNKWDDQPYRVEVWVEKEALAGVVARAANAEDVSYFSCRGYTSQSEMWAAGQRLQSYSRRGQTPCIIHLGDHDPSGIDMTRDIRDRLRTFMGGCEVKRIALNMDQVERYSPPPNPAKMTDSRFAGYEERFGDESWELDALDPATLDALIRKTIRSVRDDGLYLAALREETEQRAYLKQIQENWDEVRDLIDSEFGAPEVDVVEDELDDVEDSEDES